MRNKIIFDIKKRKCFIKTLIKNRVNKQLFCFRKIKLKYRLLFFMFMKEQYSITKIKSRDLRTGSPRVQFKIQGVSRHTLHFLIRHQYFNLYKTT